MTTSVLPRGRQTAIDVAYQVNFGTAKTADFFRLNTYGVTFKRDRPLEDDDVQGATYHNDIDARPAAPSLEDGTATLRVPFDLVQLGFWLKAAMGSINSGVADPKVHTFTTGGPTLPTMTIQRTIAAGQFEKLVGAFVKSIKFPTGPATGYREVVVELGCQRVTEPYAESISGDPTVVALGARVPGKIGLIKIGGATVGSVMSGELTLTNEVLLDRYADDTEYYGAAALVGQSVAITFTARYSTDALRAYGNTGGALVPAGAELDLPWTLTNNLKLAVNLPVVRFTPVDVPAENGKHLTVNLNGRAEVSTGEAMMVAVLTNSQASYAPA